MGCEGCKPNKHYSSISKAAEKTKVVEETTFIRKEDFKTKCVSVVLRQSNGVWGVCLFDKEKDKLYCLDFQSFENARDYADKWMYAKRHKIEVPIIEKRIEIKKKKKEE